MAELTRERLAKSFTFFFDRTPHGKNGCRTIILRLSYYHPTTVVLSSYDCLASSVMLAISSAINLAATKHRQEFVREKNRSSDVNKT